MKKIININLSGRVTPIEDSAYEKLQGYIESLRRYFAKEEGRDEIINDIESRIAELMNEKVRKGASAINDADVEEIISSMGRVEDFDEPADDTYTAVSGDTTTTQAATEPRRSRLYRDSSDKLLGGVCSGIANAINIDPAIVRIIFALLIFGAGTGVLLYILLWIFLPARDLESNLSKRLFRNPDDKVIGGVAGGLGSYFNVAPWTIRLIFLAPIILHIFFSILNGVFGGWDRDLFPNLFVFPFSSTFVLTYVILWIVLPEARSAYEKMEMRGEKVDVNRIKQNVQEGMSDVKTKVQNFGSEVKASAEQLGARAKEFANTRGKAFAGEVSEAARPVSRGFGHVIGVLFRAFIIFIIGCVVFSLFVALMVTIFGGIAWWPIHEFLWTSNAQQFAAWGTLLFFIGVPIIALLVWVIRRIARVRSRSKYLGWTFGGLWIIGWICLFFFGSSIARDVREYDRVTNEVQMQQPASGKIIVTVAEPEIRFDRSVWFMEWDGKGFGLENDTMKYNNVKLRILKSEDSLYHTTVYKYSFGRNTTDITERANQTQFSIVSRDSLLEIGSGLKIPSGTKFRGQGIILEIQVPVNKKIRFDESVRYAYDPWVVRRYDRDWGRRNAYRYRIDWDQDEYYNWDPNIDYVMTAEGKLIDPLNPNKDTDLRNEYNDYRYERDNDDSIELKRLEERMQRLKEKRRIDSLNRISNGRTKENDEDLSNTGSPVFSLVTIFY